MLNLCIIGQGSSSWLNQSFETWLSVTKPFPIHVEVGMQTTNQEMIVERSQQVEGNDMQLYANAVGEFLKEARDSKRRHFGETIFRREKNDSPSA